MLKEVDRNWSLLAVEDGDFGVLAAGKKPVTVSKLWLKISAICRQFAGLSASWKDDTSVQFPLERCSYLPQNTNSFETNWHSGWQHQQRGCNEDIQRAGELNRKEFQTDQYTSYSLNSTGSICATEIQIAPLFRPQVPFSDTNSLQAKHTGRRF